MNFTLPRRLFAEFIGTGLLLACVVGSGIMAKNLAGGNAAIALLGNTVATGAILHVLITMLGPISGAHFNPVVSVVFGLRHDMPWRDVMAYLPVQMAGAIFGVILAHMMFDMAAIQVSETARTGTGIWIGECVATFGLVGTILITLKFRPEAVAQSVALFVTAGYWFTSSTCFANPAVAIARSLTDTMSGIRPGDLPYFIVFEVIGAAVAYYVCRWLLRAQS
jgi:glycerol uptake facilitator-like aquaporin